MTAVGCYRAEACHVAAFEALQRDAFGRNRALLGAEPLPLLTDHADIIAGKEVWLTGHEENPDGALALQPEKDSLLIWSIAVSSHAQGRGLGNLLLDFAEERARALALPALTLYTGEPLIDNIAWYRRHGFEITGIETLPDRRIVHMKKNIYQL